MKFPIYVFCFFVGAGCFWCKDYSPSHCIIYKKAANASQHHKQANDDCLSEILTHPSGPIWPSANALNDHVFQLLSIHLTMFFFFVPSFTTTEVPTWPLIFRQTSVKKLALHLIYFFRIYAERLSQCGADQTSHYLFKELKVSMHHFTTRSNKFKAFQDQGPLVKMQFILPCAVSKEGGGGLTIWLKKEWAYVLQGKVTFEAAALYFAHSREPD